MGRKKALMIAKQGYAYIKYLWNSQTITKGSRAIEPVSALPEGRRLSMWRAVSRMARLGRALGDQRDWCRSA